MLGLVFGVGSVIAMLAIGEGASREALDRIRRLGSRNIMVVSKKPPEEKNAKQKTAWFSIYGLLYSDAERIAATIPTVTCTVPVKALVKPCRLGKRAQDLRVVCTTDEWFRLVVRDVLAGRVMTGRDMREFAPVAVLTEWGARKLLANEHAVGQTLTIDSNTYQVVGIVKSEAGDADVSDSPDSRTDVYIPLAAARQRYGDVFFRWMQGATIREKVELHEIIAQVDREENVEATSKAIARLLETSHKNEDYAINVPLQLLRQAEATKRTFSIVLGAIAGISLLVGGIGIMNIMLASVTERTREIGIRRAIGARRGQIVTQFLIEALALSVIGGLIGMALGLAIPFAVTFFAEMPTVVTVWSLALSFGISVGVGIGFGIYPAIRASKLDPIIALRYE
ncbi:MAG: ABC transporter permease [Kiritimatiellae bacterium]|nr:ABC transporter permease [Kiritimatiellia bacterium]